MIGNDPFVRPHFYKGLLSAPRRGQDRGGKLQETRYGRKFFHGHVILSKLESRRLMGSINQWIAGSKERDLCVAKSMRRSAEPTQRCRNA